MLWKLKISGQAKQSPCSGCEEFGNPSENKAALTTWSTSQNGRFDRISEKQIVRQCAGRYKKDDRWESESSTRSKIPQKAMASCTKSSKHGKSKIANRNTQGKSWKKGKQKSGSECSGKECGNMRIGRASQKAYKEKG